MAQKLTIDISGDGKLKVDYEGFQGEACFREAEKLQAKLAEFGVKVETQHVDPKRNEVELRRLETRQTAGR